MKNLGILGRYLPEFGRITGQMQYDLFHIYTVDAHTLQVLRNMRWMSLGKSKEKFPLASKLIEKYSNLAREALSSGDKILSENYFQHADHFTRILNDQDLQKRNNLTNDNSVNLQKDLTDTKEEKNNIQKK